MGFFSGSRDEEWEAIKDEYRQTKIDIEECAQQIALHRDTEASNGTQFEYYIGENMTDAAIHTLGMKGWELVNFVSYTVGFGINGNSSMTVHLKYIFKRNLSEGSQDRRSWMERLNALEIRKAELVSVIEARGFRAE